jgi:hypothetical protein
MNRTQTNPLLYVACYAIWLGLCVALLWLLIQLRTNILDFAYLFGARPAMASFVDRLALIPLALIVVGVAIWLEHSLRESVPTGALWRCAGKAALVVGGAIAISFLLHIAVVTIRLNAV